MRNDTSRFTIALTAMLLLMGLVASPAAASKRSDASAENEAAATKFCATYRANNPGTECKVDKRTCPKGYVAERKWKGKGTNYSACVKGKKSERGDKRKAEKEDVAAEHKRQAEALCREKRTEGLECKVVRANVLGCGGKSWKKEDKFDNQGTGKDYLACTRAVWKVNVQFVIASAARDSTIEAWVNKEIEIAEALFDDDPALKIVPTFVYETKRGGKDLDDATFKNDQEYSKFMDKHFDTVAHSKTSGYMQVLVQTGQSGRAAFPHRVNPLSRKHGARVQVGVFSTLAHELGHTFGLLHTWDVYTTANCNKDYKKGEKNQGSTKRTDGSVNVMDYNRGTITPFLNECQRDRAAKRRRAWTTNGGHVNYQDIKGDR